MKDLNPNGSIERYHAAVAYAQSMKDRLTRGARYEDVVQRLSEGWAMEHAHATGMGWDEVREVVANAWNRADEVTADDTANHGGFIKPPTFGDQGTATPRNVDEPNR